MFQKRVTRAGNRFIVKGLTFRAIDSGTPCIHVYLDMGSVSFDDITRMYVHVVNKLCRSLQCSKCDTC